MAIFTHEELEFFNVETEKKLAETFKQKPTILPLTPRPTEILIVKQQPDALPIIAIVGIIGLFAFLGFLAMRKS